MQKVLHREFESISKRVYEILKRDLLQGRWPPHTQLKIRDLAAELNVGAMPVRVALKQLGEEGSLVLSENRSARVPHVSRRRFNEFFDISIALEGLAVEKAAEQMTDADLTTLQRKAKDMSALLDRDDAPNYIQSYNSFLMQVYKIAGSSALIEMIEKAWLQTAAESAILFRSKDIMAILQDYQLRMLDALMKRDGPGARQALTAGLTHTQRIINVLLDAAEDRQSLAVSDGHRNRKSP